MVSTFPVSLSKEKYRTRPDFKGFVITRLARYLLSDAPSLPPPVEKPRSRIRVPQFEKLIAKPGERTPAFFLLAGYVQKMHIRHLGADHFRDGTKMLCVL